MEIYKFKEVCKHVVVDGVHKIVPVRGVYVASEYRPPYIIDNMVSIEAISNTPATIQEYTEFDVDAYQDCLTHASINISDVAGADVTYYTKANETVYQDIISHASIDISAVEPTVIYYTRGYETCYDDKVYADITVTSAQATVINMPTAPNNVDDFTVAIVGITGNQATIT